MLQLIFIVGFSLVVLFALVRVIAPVIRVILTFVLYPIAGVDYVVGFVGALPFWAGYWIFCRIRKEPFPEIFTRDSAEAIMIFGAILLGLGTGLRIYFTPGHIGLWDAAWKGIAVGWICNLAVQAVFEPLE